MNILTLNKISPCGTDRLTDTYTVGDSVPDPAAILVRSADMHGMDLPASVLAVARAGAGVNNIPLDKYGETGVVVFNTPGANANAVKEIVLAGLLLASRRIVQGIEWAQTLKGQADVPALVEKGKSKFEGPELKGKTLGVIGLGAVGALVANMAAAMGMEVYGYDPFLSVDAAWGLSSRVKKAAGLEQVYALADYITVHAPLTADTKGMINADALVQMKDGVRVLNFSRDTLVDAAAMREALASGKVKVYVVDFPTEDMLGVEGVIAVPHLGASTPESEDNCAVMAADELRAYLEEGNILHSVNYPDVDVPRTAKARICVLHRNIPNMLTRISGLVSEEGINIETMTNRSRKELAYTILDVQETPSAACLQHIQAIDGVIRVRAI